MFYLLIGIPNLLTNIEVPDQAAVKEQSGHFPPCLTLECNLSYKHTYQFLRSHMTAPDKIFSNIFLDLLDSSCEKCLPADNSHEIQVGLGF